MVKVDYTRDYYGDLDLLPGADLLEIKRQFKRLALTYHPDRNPGRESEVTAKFQRIQSAHEVLIDPQERAKYDANRARSSRYGGQSSGVRGNPWSNAASAYPPPPKAPTAQQRQRPPPPSTGARRYEKFSTPPQSAYAASHEGAQARKETYTAWEHLRPQNGASDYKPGPGKTWKAPEPPPRGTPQSGREESNARRHEPPPRAGPSYQEFREANSSPRFGTFSAAAAAASKKNGFMPNIPSAGDEPPAPMGAYFTDRNKPTVAPEVPPREVPAREVPAREVPAREVPAREVPPREVPAREAPPRGSRPPRSARRIPDPLGPFKDKAMSGEPRISTPYSTHGGEKFDPFESTNFTRSKSTRERAERHSTDSIHRAGSDSHLNSPQRTRSFAHRNSTKADNPTESVNLDGSGSDSGSDDFVKTAPHAKSTTHSATPARGQSDASAHSNTNGQVPGSSRPQTQPQAQANGDTMYASSDSSHPDRTFMKVPNFSVKLPTVSEDHKEPATRGPLPYKKPTKYFMDDQPVKSPTAAATTDPQSLNAFEGFQRNLVDQLLHNKRNTSLGQKSRPSPGFAETPVYGASSRDWTKDPHYQYQQAWQEYREPYLPGSPSKKSKPTKHLHSVHPYDFDKSREFWAERDKMKQSQANYPNRTSSFSFNVNDDTFSRTRAHSSGFSNSADNISTKFASEDWDGKFEAGADYFKPNPEQQKIRAQSTSRPRGRSPVKHRPADLNLSRPRGSDTPIESPGGTKFSAEEWNKTFKPQTFMPSPSRMSSIPRSGPSPRPTMGGNAAVVSDGEMSDEKPLFTGRKNMASNVGSPEPMDVDTPPANNTVPDFANVEKGHSNIHHGSNKRAASVSASRPPGDAAALNVEFEDLRIRDLMSTLAMPTAPQPPALPEAPSEYERPTRAAYDDYVKRYTKYLKEWDIFNSKFLLHLVARKNQTAKLGGKRVTEEAATEVYRIGVREDQAVLRCWGDFLKDHEKVVKAFIVVRERMKSREEREGGIPDARQTERPRPRKKTH